MIHLGSRAYAFENEQLWFSNFNFNGLFQMDISTGKVKWVHKFETISDNKIGAHRFAFKDGERLVFIPGDDDKILIYDIRMQTEEIVQIPKQERGTFCSAAYKERNKIWIFPSHSLEAVFCFDICTKRLEMDEKLSCIFSEFTRGEKKDLRVSVQKNILLLCAKGEGRICRIELDTLEKRNYDFGRPIFKVFWDGSDYWVLMEDVQDVYRWNPESNSRVKFKVTENEWVDDKRSIPYEGILFAGEKVILINYYCAHVMQINREEQCVEKAFEFPEEFRVINELSWGAVFSSAIVVEDKVYFLPQRGSQVWVWNLISGVVRGEELAISKSSIPYLEHMIETDMKEKCVRESEELYDLQKLLSVLEVKERKVNFEGQVGTGIYSKVKEEYFWRNNSRRY